MANTTTFLGFRQVTGDYYRKLSADEKKFYLWLVRDIIEASGATKTHSEIYFGTRKYAEVNEDAASDYTVNNIIESLGLIDENGEYIGFLPDETEVMADADSIKDALLALEEALGKKADSEYVDEEIEKIEDEIDDIQSQIDAITSGSAADVKYEDNTIFLVNKDGEKVGEGFDASSFVVDGVLDEVTMSGDTLVFTFNAAAGKNDIIVPLDKFIDPAELKAAVEAEEERAKGAEKDLEDAISDEETRAKEAEEELEAGIDAVSGAVQDVRTELIERIETIEKEMEEDTTHIIEGDDVEV